MLQLSDISKRIRSVSDIRQMTKAMQLISAVKMKKAKDQLETAYPFFALCAETFALLRYHAERDNETFLHARKRNPAINGVKYSLSFPEIKVSPALMV